MNRAFLAGLTIAFSLALGGCQGSVIEACQWLGACTQPDPAAERIIILCDQSTGSSCSGSNLDSAIISALRHSVNRPGSRLELWALGQDVASTRMVATFTITRPIRNGARAISAHRDSQIDAARTLFHREISPYLRSRPPSKSPLVFAIAKLSLAGHNGVPSHYILVTDGLEFGFGWDFECWPPRDTAHFRRAIQNSGILTPTSLRGSTVTFAFVALGPIDGNRCPVEIGRARKIRELWISILTAFGARRVEFESGPPQLETFRDFHELLTKQGEQP